MNAIPQVTGTGVPLLLDDIDTDRIIPARFLRCVSFDGIGDHAFEDDREQDPAHPFNQPQYQNAGILVSGRNFGCGSSREHAPQSLMRWGIRGIVSESYAEIFFGNCTSLGIPAVCAKRADLEALAQAVQNDPSMEVTVDLENLEVRFGDQKFPCTIPDSARDALVSGRWDFLAQLLENQPQIVSTLERLPYTSGFEST
ncbi:MAG: 3-isopropylmalate dehydratase small subunit [Planctomycetaceae bacterium]|nr:3-isopropylmalate dehydratase small subunit [Planctomycetaceae bacterium]